jgi:hypothetical protein
MPSEPSPPVEPKLKSKIRELGYWAALPGVNAVSGACCTHPEGPFFCCQACLCLILVDEEVW